MHTPEHVKRPPQEYASVPLLVSRGCSYHRCRFCTLYDCEFSWVPFSQIEEDVAEIAAHPAAVRRVMLIGGNPMGLSNERLVPILELLNKKLPNLKSIGGYFRLEDMAHKGDAELAEMRRLKVDDILCGAETGYDPALAYMEKGCTVAEELEQCRRLDAAGIGYSFFYMPGLAGAGHCEEAGRATAEAWSQVHPRHILVLTATPFPGSRWREDIEAGRFEQASETEILREQLEFMKRYTGTTKWDAEHQGNTAPISVYLPLGQKKAISYLEQRIATANEAAMRRVRDFMTAL